MVRVDRRPMERVIMATGTLAAQEDSTVSAKVPGRLQRLAVDLGSSVRQGDVIAQVEPRDYELRLAQAAAALAQARAALGLSAEGEDDLVDLEQISLVRQTKAVLQEASKNLERVKKLAQSGVASASELDTVEATQTVALTRYLVALEEVQTRRATLAQRRVELEIARKQLADTTVVAPFEGSVQARLANLGEYLAAGTRVVRLVKTDPLRLRLDVPEREAVLVRSGQVVRLALEGSTNVFIGRISRLSPALDDMTRMLRVEADVPNEGGLRPGLFASAQIIVAEQEDGLSLPASALITFAGLEKVVLVEAGKAVEKPVTTGRRGVGWVEVVAGLEDGVEVVLDPGGLRTGQLVTVRNRAGDPQTAGAPLKSGQ